jgi:hypothetical protein
MRLRRGGRTKGDKNAPRVADAALAVAQASADPEPPGPMAVGSVLGLHSLTADAPRRPPIDEWGLYDPDMCGYGALLASLGTAENKEAEPVEEDPAELLLRQQARPLGLPTDALQPEPAADSDKPHPSAAASAVAACRVAHFAPLALWARLNECESQASVSTTFSPGSRAVARWMARDVSRSGACAGDDLAALVGRLTLPAHIVATRHASGCTIRHVRIAPAPDLPDVALLPDSPGGIEEELPLEAGPVEPEDSDAEEGVEPLAAIETVGQDTASGTLEIDDAVSEAAADRSASAGDEPNWASAGTETSSDALDVVGPPEDGAAAPDDAVEIDARCDVIEPDAFEDEHAVARIDTSGPVAAGSIPSDGSASITLDVSADAPEAQPVLVCSVLPLVPRRARVAMALG